MNRLLVYVAAPLEAAAEVRELHADLRREGLEPCSRWADLAEVGVSAARVEHSMNRAKCEALIAMNDDDVARASVVVILSKPKLGAECFAEVARALLWQKPVLWVGRLTLSAWRPNVYLCQDREHALAALTWCVARRPVAVGSLRTAFLLSEFFRAHERHASGG